MLALVLCCVVLSATVDVAESRYTRHTVHFLSARKTIATWEEADQICRNEGATLASPIDPELFKEMKTIIGINSHTTAFFIGIKAGHNSGLSTQFVSREGIPVDEMPNEVLNTIEQLDPSKGDCLCMTQLSINVVSCLSRLPYFCYKNVTNAMGYDDNSTSEPETGANPSMSHRPMIVEDGPLIWYNADNATQVNKYVDNINELLAPYYNLSLLVNGGQNLFICKDEKPPQTLVCDFDTRNLGPCSPSNHYGYTNRRPCLIIKLNSLIDWNPDIYDDPADLPPEMPSDITNYINHATPQQRRKVWVSCKGERTADVQALGPLKYWPYPGLPETYFPFVNTPGYLSPVVAVQLTNPALHQLIKIRCRAWARNIQVTESPKEQLGSTYLEIMID